MKMLTASIALSVALVGVAHAQRTAPAPVPSSAPNFLFGGTPPAPQRSDSTEPPPDVVGELFKGITLAPEQAARLDSIRERYIVQFQVFTPGVRPSPAIRQRVRALVTQELAEARAVLTPEQQQVWDLNVAGVVAMFASGMPELFPTVAKPDVSTPLLSGTGPGSLLNSLLQGIALTPDQRVRVDAIRARYGSQAPVVPAGTQPDSAAVRQIRELSRQTLEAIRAVLSPGQQTVWDRNLTQALTSSMRVGP